MEKSLAFVHYILGLIDASPDGFDENKTSLVKNKLHDIFEHEIDPSFGFTESEKKTVDEVHSLSEDVNDLLCANDLDNIRVTC